MGIVEEEADEAAYWMELLTESEVVPRQMTEALVKESNELVAIVVSSIKTTRKNAGLAE